MMLTALALGCSGPDGRQDAPRPAEAARPAAPATCVVTDSSMGPIGTGMTLADARRALPGATFERGYDGEGVGSVGVVLGADSIMSIVADGDEDEAIDWSKRIVFIETFSPTCRTADGVHPGALVRDVEKNLGPIARVIMSEIEESRTFAGGSEARLSSIFASAMDAIISVNEQQRIVVFNEAAERIFGCPTADALGSSLDRFIPKRFRASHEQHIRAFEETGVTAARSMGALRPLAALRADGTEFPIEATISQVEVGGQRLFTVILRDVAEIGGYAQLRTGLGLAISRDRARGMGGDLLVQSVLDEGSTFTVVLPLSASEARPSS